jgi:hypothetical protein
LNHIVEFRAVQQVSQDATGWPWTEVDPDVLIDTRRKVDVGSQGAAQGLHDIGQRRVLGNNGELSILIGDLRSLCR